MVKNDSHQIQPPAHVIMALILFANQTEDLSLLLLKLNKTIVEP